MSPSSSSPSSGFRTGRGSSPASASLSPASASSPPSSSSRARPPPPGREALSKAALAALVLVAVHVLLQIADHVVWERILKPRHISVPRLLFDIFNALVLAGVAVTLLKVLYSFNLTGLLVTSTVLSAILGLSLQDVLSSLMAGIALQMEGPLAPKEWVRVGDKEGEVVQMNWRSLTLRSRDGHHVVLPNSRVAREDIVNYSRPGPAVMLHATIGVAYAHPPGEMEPSSRRRSRGRMASRPPIPSRPSSRASPTRPSSTTSASGPATSRASPPSPRRGPLPRLVRPPPRGLRDSVPAARDRPPPGPRNPGRRAPPKAPSRELRRTEKRRDVPAGPPTSRSRTSPATHASNATRPARRSCARAKRDALSSSSAPATCASSERTAPSRASSRGAGPGSFFGEMSLLTGEPRSASVVALGEVEVVVVEKDAFSTLLHDDGHLARALSEALEERSRSQARVEAPAADAVGPQATTDGLLDRIQRFFGLEG